MPEPRLLSAGIRDVSFGEGVTVVEPVNLYECTIGEGTFVGPFVEIQGNSSIGKNCRIQSHTFICELVTIGDDTFIGHGVKFINDKFSTGGPARGNKDLWEGCIIGSRVSIGSNATILPVTVCDDVVVGAGSVVTKDISTPGVYVGNPAKRIR